MKKRAKEKTPKKLKASGPELPDLVTAMMKLVERLEALEKKTDLVITQTAVRFFEGREHPKPASQPIVVPQSFRQPDSMPRSNEGRPAQGQAQGHRQERRERILHKAVCADCHKDCEVPFKPTGERPVYCKECFSKRKSGGHLSKGNPGNQKMTNPPKAPVPSSLPQRQVVVTKKGVGKVTVSEIVRHPARGNSPKNKSHKPAKKSKRG